MYKRDCFAYQKKSSGYICCSALKSIACDGCKFYKTKDDYNKNVSRLKHEK